MFGLPNQTMLLFITDQRRGSEREREREREGIDKTKVMATSK
jgi:hypothetical protein